MSRPRPIRISAPHGAPNLTLTWSDQMTTVLSHDLLRGYCPCATCQGEQGDIRFRLGGNTELIDLRPVGSYALQLVWGDGHDSGLYSFDYLRQLARAVEQRGLSVLLVDGTRLEP